MGCLFTFSSVPFEAQKFLGLMHDFSVLYLVGCVGTSFTSKSLLSFEDTDISPVSPCYDPSSHSGRKSRHPRHSCGLWPCCICVEECTFHTVLIPPARPRPSMASWSPVPGSGPHAPQSTSTQHHETSPPPTAAATIPGFSLWDFV